MRSTVPAFFDSDKIEPHGYFQTYVRIAAELGPKARVCELGVENGESLRIWQALFPVGEIWGVDYSPAATWPEGTRGAVCNQDDPALPGLLGGTFGLIVDDASHDGNKTTTSFNLLWPLVQPGGFYVVEDWTVALRDDPHWGKQSGWGDSMLRCAEAFLPLLAWRDGEVESIEYRYGLIILRKNPAAAATVLPSWAAVFEDDDRALFLAEVRAAPDAGAREKCLRAWRVTAEALSDPAVAAVLTSPLDGADFGEVPRP